MSVKRHPNISYRRGRGPLFTRKWLRYVWIFAIANPSVCLSSVTFVHPTQGLEYFSNISSPLCT